MSPAHYLAPEENLYFVPILRQRLNFSVLVRRALRDLEPWTSEDLIAVSLPPSVEIVLRGVIQQPRHDVLPIFLVIASWEGSQYQEVFPITPCDAMVEASRFAVERNLPLAAIDTELASGNLIERQCLGDSDWPDDGLVLRWGPSRYMDMISELLLQPPTRFEPIDTWRENGIAERLRALQPYYRRILVVCEAVHVTAVRRLLRRHSEGLASVIQTSSTPYLRVARAKPEVMLRYLDDFPRLVESYEVHRHAEQAANFDKWSEILRIVQMPNSNDESSGGSLAIRRIQIFHRFLLQLLERKRLISPRPYEVYQACRSCFGDIDAKRIVHQLGCYGKELTFERVGEVLPSRDPLYSIKAPESSSEGFFVSRSCNPTQPQYALKERPYSFPGGGGRSGNRTISPSASFVRKMRTKAEALISRVLSERRTVPFQGSIESGIDTRRTLRAFAGPFPTIFVRQNRQRKKLINMVGEPIVWIFRPMHQRKAEGYELSCLVDDDDLPPEGSGGKYAERSQFLGPKEVLFTSSDQQFEINRQIVLGMVSFFEGTSAQVRKQLGVEFNSRIPDHSHMQPFHSLGCVLSEFEPYVMSDIPWWDILLLMAVRYSKKSVLCLLPEGFRLSELVTSHASNAGRQLLCASVTKYTKLERERLGMRYSVNLPESAPDDEAMVKRIQDVSGSLGGLY